MIFKIIFKLREIRIKKRQTQVQLSRMSGVSQSHISEIELDKESPTLIVVAQLANALKVDLYEIIEQVE